MLEFSKVKKVGEAKVVVDIMEDDIETIIAGCFEGGSNYWMGLDNSTPEWKQKPKGEPLATWGTKILLEGGSIKLTDVEGDEDDSNWVLTLDKLLKGIRMHVENRPRAGDIETWDADDTDCIMQYALFDEVVFG